MYPLGREIGVPFAAQIRTESIRFAMLAGPRESGSQAPTAIVATRRESGGSRPAGRIAGSED
jgi:hypothetical protein